MSGGIFTEILEELKKLNGLDNYNSLFDEEKLKLVLNRIILRENVFPLFHAVLIGAKTEKNKIISVTLASKTQKIEVEAEYFIDCTGDGNLAVMAGPKFLNLMKNTNRQRKKTKLKILVKIFWCLIHYTRAFYISIPQGL